MIVVVMMFTVVLGVAVRDPVGLELFLFVLNSEGLSKRLGRASAQAEVNECR
jgi:hypothetical protein